MSRPQVKQQRDNNEVSVRLADRADAAAISEILQKAFGEIREYYTAEAFEVVTPRPAEVAGRFDEGPLWVAEIDSRIVGTVSLTTEAEGLYVRSMAVLPGEQGRGIGRKLLDALHEFAAAQESKRIFLYTLPFQKGARAMYEKHGYRWVRDTPAEEWYGVPGLEMDKEL